MLGRREFLRASVFGCGATIAGEAFGSSVIHAVYADNPASAKPIVTTSLGRLRGAFANGVYSFKGVHYGASTEGPMRFLPPAPARPWIGVRDALQIGPPAPQDRDWASRSTSDIHVPDLIGPGMISEDCLVLNVWSPSLSGPSKRPVMVWLHGGGYTIGSSGAPMYDGANLAGKQNVVIVGVNHRLNVFGYLYLGKIGGDKYAGSGNVGMLDIALALRWVRDNIAHFGGDPDNVTIFGQSGGGGKVSTLMAMPAGQGLFHKAIVESGSELRVNSREEADEATRKFLAHIHVAPDRLSDLLEMPMEQIIAGMHSMTEPDPMSVLGPVVDGQSLPRHPFDPDAPVLTARVPMLIGTTSTETTNLLGRENPRLFSLDEAEMRSKLKALLGLHDDSKLNTLIDAYKKDLPDASPSEIYFAVTTDQMMRMDAITQAERKTTQGVAPAYMYLFAWRTPVLGGKLKSPHGIEMPFVFDNLDGAEDRIGTGADLQSLADKVSGAWAAFARTGDPSHLGIPPWPAYTLKDRATMILNEECKVVNDPGKEERIALSILTKT
ncbi:MAG: carboxylesterase/lipase family protein [Candidatus Acidiferrales bacterium]